MIKSSGLIFFLVLGAIRAQAAPDAIVTLRFSTEPTSGRYSPLHVLAAWVADAQGHPIRTLETHGQGHRRHLIAWKRATHKAEASSVDAVTSATLSAHGPREIRWDGRDPQGRPVPDGNYEFFVEFTESNGRGPLLRVPFHKGPKKAIHKPPPEKYFRDIELTVLPGA
jgi:hypothetical protein